MFVGNGTSLELAANRRLKGRRLCQSDVGAAFAAGVRSCQLHLCLCGSQREAVVDSVEECAAWGQLGRISRCLAMAVSPERVPCAVYCVLVLGSRSGVIGVCFDFGAPNLSLGWGRSCVCKLSSSADWARVDGVHPADSGCLAASAYLD